MRLWKCFSIPIGTCALIVSASVGTTPLLVVPANAMGFCAKSPIAKQRCEAAKNLLRHSFSGLRKDAQENDRPDAKPNGAKPEGTKPEGTKDEAVKPGLGDDPIDIQSNLETSKKTSQQLVYIPFPTPRPFYQAPLQKKPTQEDAIDPTTTEGILSRCLDARQIKERDIRAHLRTLKKEHFCITRKKVRENGFDWKIYTIKNKEKPRGPLFVVTHDNEDSAFSAGVYGLNKYGGSLVAVESGERRTFKGQDPNRNFSTRTRTARHCRLQRAKAPRFTRAILKQRKRGQPIIALHSNADGFRGNGGRGDVSIRKKSKNTIPFISAIGQSRRLKDEDTLLIVAGTKPLRQDPALRRTIKHFTQKVGVHVLYERVSHQSNDCSLSNYVVLNGLGAYFNIEVETGDTRTQRTLLDHVVTYVSKSPKS